MGVRDVRGVVCMLSPWVNMYMAKVRGRGGGLPRRLGQGVESTGGGRSEPGAAAREPNRLLLPNNTLAVLTTIYDKL